eukprot:g1510.t1
MKFYIFFLKKKFEFKSGQKQRSVPSLSCKLLRGMLHSLKLHTRSLFHFRHRFTVLKPIRSLSSTNGNNGLYDSSFEHDACGVGFVASISGKSSHSIVQDGQEILERMQHRGACGEEANSGDGAGVMTGIPDEFLRKEFGLQGVELPEVGGYVVGNVFLNPRRVIREESKRHFERIAEETKLSVLGWRKLPVDNSTLGMTALAMEPVVEQVVLAPLLDATINTSTDLERRAFLLMQRSRNSIRGTGSGASGPKEAAPKRAIARAESLKQTSSKGDALPTQISKGAKSDTLSAILGRDDYFYLCSLSPTTLVYKGQFTCDQLFKYYSDLTDTNYSSHFAMVHSRFSTNTFPSWERAQPMRTISHNGEINTVRGNRNWMRAREGFMLSPVYEPTELETMYPVIDESSSDSGCLDDAIQFLKTASYNRSLYEVIMMMVPEAWENKSLDPSKKAFYEWSSFLMEPWDGPALLAFSDGRYIGATLDRNGLRPCRYFVTADDKIAMSSEVGTLYCPEDQVTLKGHLEPGKMLLVDTVEQKIVEDNVLKHQVASKNDYTGWVKKQVTLNDIIANQPPGRNCVELAMPPPCELSMDNRLPMFGWSQEDIQRILSGMIVDGKESLGSMGNDTPLAFMSQSFPRLLFDFFKQHFAQVTNPPIDPFRESSVMTLRSTIGPAGNILNSHMDQCRRLVLERPILTTEELNAISLSPPARPDRIPGAKLRGVRRELEGTEYGYNSRHGHIKKRQRRRPLATRDQIASADESWRGRAVCVGPTKVIPITFPKYARNVGLFSIERELRHLCSKVDDAVESGASYIVLSDRSSDSQNVPMPSLLALGAVHQHLIRSRRRLDVGLIVDTGEAREVHHYATLIGFGADAVCPYLTLDVIHQMVAEGVVEKRGLTRSKASENYLNAVDIGLKKVMAKMGISTLQGYKGAQIFEAIGLDSSVTDMCFTGVASRIGGLGFEDLSSAAVLRHEYSHPSSESLQRTHELPVLANAGLYHWRDGGEAHVNTPEAIAALQVATKDVTSKSEKQKKSQQNAYQKFSQLQREATKNCTLRGLLDIVGGVDRSIPLSKVEPASEIVKRFVTGAMSLGSISPEAHETLALAMNEIGGKSNTGEGGEDPTRLRSKARSSIKQIASGRFGVTIEYLSEADELQIKMAQGAKPGEGGELPGHKVNDLIASLRHSTPGVGLISPPPHHDIYSIEDLAQLILDLRCLNGDARISVKLVSEAGVGTIAAGVAKAHANHILISGHDGGTGASSWTGIKHAGLPWELGLAETHQTLVLNNLRGRVRLQTDGQIRTGRDVVVAALLGAEEFGFSTVPLISMGCIMMRKCHLNTCPVGIATQDPELRKKFNGKPENVINYFFAVAEEVRGYMAKLGFASLDEMVGRSDYLRPSPVAESYNLDLNGLLKPADTIRPDVPTVFTPGFHEAAIDAPESNHLLEKELCDAMNKNFENGEKEFIIPQNDRLNICNVDRSFGASLSHKLYQARCEDSDRSMYVSLCGSAGQSFGAFLATGGTVDLEGEGNDYVGKGLSGGEIIIRKHKEAKFDAADNVIAGNTCLYGATSGKTFISGKAGQRFCVRNSGATAVVEGIGDHGAEYMTGGRLVVLGDTGINFAAGMSGGLAYVYDPSCQFPERCNTELVDLVKLEDENERVWLQSLIREHAEKTESQRAINILSEENWSDKFVKVYPRDYRKVLESVFVDEEEEDFQEMQQV